MEQGYVNFKMEQGYLVLAEMILEKVRQVRKERQENKKVQRITETARPLKSA